MKTSNSSNDCLLLGIGHFFLYEGLINAINERLTNEIPMVFIEFKPCQKLVKHIKLVGGRCLPFKLETLNFPGCIATRFLLVGFLAEVADKKELPEFKLLLDFFGRTFHLSWKQKNCFVMFSLRLNDWVEERCV